MPSSTFGPVLQGTSKSWRRDSSPVVFEHRPRVSEFQFEVPDVPPGRYLVALFDGGEGAGHYSWNFVTVEGPGAGTGPDAGSGAGDGWDSLLVILGAAGAALLAAIGWLVPRRFRRP